MLVNDAVCTWPIIRYCSVCVPTIPFMSGMLLSSYGFSMNENYFPWSYSLDETESCSSSGTRLIVDDT